METTNTQLLPYAEITVNELGTRETARENAKQGKQVLEISLDKILVHRV